MCYKGDLVEQKLQAAFQKGRPFPFFFLILIFPDSISGNKVVLYSKANSSAFSILIHVIVSQLIRLPSTLFFFFRLVIHIFP